MSLIATVLDEGPQLEAWIDQLFGQIRPPDEMVVVDGGSGSETLEALARAAERHPDLSIHQVCGANISEGRNIAIDRARGPVIVVTDAGTTPEPGWLKHLVAPFETNAEIAVSAGFFRPGGNSAFERLLAVVITPQLEEIDPDRFLPSSRSVAFLKDWWQAVGGYPAWLDHCEDLVFDLRLKEAGARFAFVPEARVRWTARSSLRSFMRQYFLYARGDGHAHLWFKRHAVRYGAYLAGAALVSAGRRRPWPWAVLGAGFIAYQVKFWRRIHRLPPFSDRWLMAAAYASAPVLVVCGDVAKMLGFPVGLWQRARAGGPDGLAMARRTVAGASR